MNSNDILLFCSEYKRK